MVGRLTHDFGQLFDLLVTQVALLVGLLVDELDGIEFILVVLNKLLPVLDEDFGFFFVVTGTEQGVGAVIDKLVGFFAVGFQEFAQVGVVEGFDQRIGLGFKRGLDLFFAGFFGLGVDFGSLDQTIFVCGMDEVTGDVRQLFSGQVLNVFALLIVELEVEPDHAVTECAQRIGMAIAACDLFHELGGGDTGFGFQGLGFGFVGFGNPDTIDQDEAALAGRIGRDFV